MTLWYENNPYLSVVAEVENSHAYLTTDSSITNEDDDNMNIPDKEEQKNREISRKFENICHNFDKNIKKIWRPIYEVTDENIFEETDILPQHFWTYVKIQINLSLYHLMSKHSLNEWLCNKGYTHKC